MEPHNIPKNIDHMLGKGGFLREFLTNETSQPNHCGPVDEDGVEGNFTVDLASGLKRQQKRTSGTALT